MSDIITQLKALKLYGMANSYAELRQQNMPDQMVNLELADRILSQLLQAESTERNICSIRYQTRVPDSRYNVTYKASTSVSLKPINS